MWSENQSGREASAPLRYERPDEPSNVSGASPHPHLSVVRRREGGSQDQPGEEEEQRGERRRGTQGAGCQAGEAGREEARAISGEADVSESWLDLEAIGYVGPSELRLPHRDGCEYAGSDSCHASHYSTSEIFTFADVEYLVVLPSCRSGFGGRVRLIADALSNVLGQGFIREVEIERRIARRNPSFVMDPDAWLGWPCIYRSQWTAYCWWEGVEASLPPEETCAECGLGARNWQELRGWHVRSRVYCSETCSDKRAARMRAGAAARARRKSARDAIRSRQKSDPVLAPAELDEFVDEELAAIYFLCAGSIVVYVGQTVNLPSRIRSHRASSFSFDRVLYRRVPRSRLDELEGAAIRHYAPMYNGAIPLPEDQGESDDALIAELLSIGSTVERRA